MFKTDKKSLESLSFAFNERDIANFKYILEYIQGNSLQIIPNKEIQRMLKGLEEVGRLKLNKKIYAFHVYDSYSNYQSGHGEGVELYIRQGDSLEDFCVPSDRDDVFSVDDTIEDLRSENISTIYTGQILFSSRFLGLPQKIKDFDGDVITRGVLNDYEIEEYKSEGIKVIKLDSLI